ncbi:MAG TPA: ABC transporter permease [Mucilaginibacter sp.]|nr:ABC transporter permease [Mucilaginibacter sp.]
MNIHALHISPYDLAFLCLIITGLNFALLLAFTRKVNRSANRFLALALVVMVLWMVRISTDTWLHLQFSLALGPLIYFYVLKLTQPKHTFSWKDWLHFLPVLPEQVAQKSPVLPFLAIISVIIYLYCSHRLIERFYKRLKFNGGDRNRYELRWLHRLLIGFGLLCLLAISCANAGYFYFHQQGGQGYYSFYLCAMAMLIWIAATAYLKPEATTINPPAFSKPLLPAELRHKGAWLKQAVKTNRYYRDPDLSLNSLAGKLGLTTHELSRILNTVLKKSFNDFINEYRVADVIRKMQDAGYDHITLLGIALDSGFNSQSTFTRIFKQMTGKSPTAYKNELKKDYSPYKLGSNAGFATIISFHETMPKWSREKLNRNYMFRNYLKVAFRNFSKHRVLTLINVIGLSIGISAALVIYLLVHYDFTFDKFHKDGDRIYRVVTNFSFAGSAGYNSGVCGPLPWAAKTQVTGLEEAAPIFRLWQPNVTIPNGNKTSSRFKIQDNVVVADSDYFKLFQYKWLAGSAKSALKAPYQVVLTSDQAEKYFPGVSYEQMLGRTVIYDALKATVSGIVQTIKQNTDFTFHDFISFPTAFSDPSLKEQLRLHNWGGVSPEYQFFVKLAPKVTAVRIEQQLNEIMKNNNKLRPGVTEQFALQPLADIHFNTNYGTFDGGRVADKTTLYELCGIALFLLLLGCINFINLTTAQSAQRAKEIGIRKTMGGSRKQLIFQFLSETFLITFISVIISVAITPVILRFFSTFIPEGIHADLLIQPNIILFLALLVIVVSFASGFYPALVLSGYKPVSAIKNQANEDSSKTRNAVLRKSLTVTQFAIAQFFIMATILVSKQIYYAVHKDLGFKKDAILIINSPWKNRQESLNQVLLNKFRAIPQVQLISMGRDAPTSDDPHSTEGSYKDGKKEIKIEDLGEKFGDENYIKVYHIKLLAGRNLLPGDTSKAFLINNTLAKQLGFKDPHDAVGKVISDFNGDTNMQIVGVVSDFNQESIHAAIAPLAILTSTNPYFNGTFHIALKPQTPGGDEWKTAIASMQKAWKQIYPDDDFEYQFFDESIARLYASEQKTSALLSWATGLSILISCLGLLGLAIYTTNQRTKEIGIRKVLGAKVSQIVVLLSAEMAWLIILAFVIISPVAWWAMHKWMQGFAERTAISWWIFALSGGGMLLTALGTSGLQTIKAALANPVKSLRTE